MSLVDGAVSPIVIGVDPGLSGAVVMLEGREAHARTMKSMTLRDLCDLFAEQPALNPPVVWIEDARPNPKNGSISVGKMMRTVGQLEAAIVAAHLPLHRVAASVWQLGYGLRKKKGETDTAKKNRHKAVAQELFPGLKITHAIADALLIAEYGRRQERLTSGGE